MEESSDGLSLVSPIRASSPMVVLTETSAGSLLLPWKSLMCEYLNVFAHEATFFMGV